MYIDCCVLMFYSDLLHQILFHTDDIETIISLSGVNQFYYKVISNNHFWIKKNQNYLLANFNIFDSITQHNTIISNIKKFNTKYSTCTVSHNNYINHTINKGHEYDYTLLPYYLYLSDVQFYEYGTLYSGNLDIPCTNYIYYFYNNNNKSNTTIYKQKCTCFDIHADNTSCVVYGIYVYYSCDSGTELRSYNILTGEIYTIREFSYKHVSTSGEATDLKFIVDDNKLMLKMYSQLKSNVKKYTISKDDFPPLK